MWIKVYFIHTIFSHIGQQLHKNKLKERREKQRVEPSLTQQPIQHFSFRSNNNISNSEHEDSIGVIQPECQNDGDGEDKNNIQDTNKAGNNNIPSFSNPPNGSTFTESDVEKVFQNIELSNLEKALFKWKIKDNISEGSFDTLMDALNQQQIPGVITLLISIFFNFFNFNIFINRFQKIGKN